MIETVLTLSTAHLRHDTCNVWLHHCPFAAFEKGDYGWFVFVPEDEPNDMPEDFATCVAAARALHCAWLMFDRDAPALANMPVYDW